MNWFPFTYILDNLITNPIHAWLTKDYRSSGMRPVVIYTAGKGTPGCKQYKYKYLEHLDSVFIDLDISSVCYLEHEYCGSMHYSHTSLEDQYVYNV